MDYLGWELARQRAALAALLPGGGRAGEGQDAPDGARRSPAEPGAALGSALRPAGRSAGGPGDAGAPAGEAPGAWEAVWMARPDRLPQAAARPVSAWEEIAGGDMAPEGAGRDAETGVLAGSGPIERTAREAAPGEGTGARTDLPRPSGGSAARRTARETGAAPDTAAEMTARTAAEVLAEPAAEADGSSGRTSAGGQRAGRSYGGGEALFGAEPGGGESAGLSGREAGARRGGALHSAGPVRRSGGEAETPGRNGLPAAWRDGAAGGASPWGGLRETAALRAEDEARALSRAVQRDARRYDGGFNIY